ncbi:hypothetical protein KEJ47_02180 [Candidatus Bathyarchaeota archaeon]|nr:hypothetical protein [Candidatus Bathyarchaeota archaeon]
MNFKVNSYGILEAQSSPYYPNLNGSKILFIGCIDEDDSAWNISEFDFKELLFSEIDWSIIINRADLRFKTNEQLKIEVIEEKDGVLYRLIIIISVVGGKLDGKDILENRTRRKIYEFINLKSWSISPSNHEEPWF